MLDGSKPASPSPARPRRLPWAALLQRIFALDVFASPCGSRRKIIAAITQPEVAAAILRSLDFQPRASPPPLARPPPRQLDFDDVRAFDDFVDPPYVTD